MRDTTRHSPPTCHENSGAVRTGCRVAARGTGTTCARGRLRSAHRATILPPPFAS
ncbi:hypothetical protein C7S15_5293 [Burkholderia cepacia]|nr:hypothetical protein [Burkholderia cepacia]